MGRRGLLRSATLIQSPFAGGKYGGFGSAPEPAPSSSHPSFALSSHNAPSLQDLQQDPLKALSKGWSLFSSAVAVAGSTINESVIQPGVARAGEVVNNVNDRGIGGGARYMDDATMGQNGNGAAGGRDIGSKLFEEAKATGGWLSSVAGEGWSNLNQLAKEKGGVDLNERLGRLGIKSPSHNAGYDSVGPRSFEYGDGGDERGDEDDFFGQQGVYTASSATSASAPSSAQLSAKTPAAKPVAKADGWDDEWKDF